MSNWKPPQAWLLMAKTVSKPPLLEILLRNKYSLYGNMSSWRRKAFT